MLRFLTAIILVGSAFSCAFAESIIKPIISEASVSLPRSKMVTIEDTETARKYTLFVQLPKSYNASPSKDYPVIYTTDAPYSFPIIVGSMRMPVNVGQMEEAVIPSTSSGGTDCSEKLKNAAKKVPNILAVKTMNHRRAMQKPILNEGLLNKGRMTESVFSVNN